MTDAAERSIGPYRVIRLLGRGGMGEVFLAYDPRLDRQVAIKSIRPGGDDPARRARFLREARVTAALSHPSIVQVFDFPSDEGADHIVMEYVPGTSLHALLRQGPLPLRDRLRIAAAVAEGLAYAHGRGVVHRDLKTENVLVTPGGEVKIADFGIARRRAATATSAEDESLTREGMVVGTFRAMSPEQACGEPPDSRSDLFSFGILLYELFTGQSPFLAGTPSGTVQRILTHTPKPLREMDPSLPPGLSDIVAHLLEKDPALRLWNTGEVADRLRALAGFSGSGSSGEATAQAPTFMAGPTPAAARWTDRSAESPPDPPRGGGRRLGRAGLTAIAAGTVVLLAALLAYLFLRPASPFTTSAGSPLHVAVLAPALRGGAAGEDVEYLRFALRGALQSGLTSLAEVYPRGTSEVDAVAGPPTAVARAMAADEVLETTLVCKDGSCSINVSRLRGTDGGATWSGQIEVPLADLLTATRAVRVLVRQAYAERRPRPGVPEVEVTPEDYAEYLRIKRSMTAGIAQPADVLARLAAIRRRSPRFVDAYVLASQKLLNELTAKRDPALAERALDLLAQARSLAPGDPEVAFVRIDALRLAGRLDEAERTLEELAAQAPGDVRVLDLRAGLLEQRGRPAEALAVARTAVERQPAWWRLYEYAKLAWRQGEIATARRGLDQLFERYPGNPQGRQMLATLELTNGDPQKAAALYEEIVARSPHPGMVVNLGLARLLTGDSDGAARAFEKAVAAEPSNYLFLLNLAQARLLQRRPAEAEALFRRVLALSDRDAGREDPQRFTVRAQALAHLGRRNEAVLEVQEALRLAPRSGAIAFEVALVYALVGDRTAALVNAQRARDLGFDAPGWFRLPWFTSLRNEPAFRSLLDD